MYIASDLIFDSIDKDGSGRMEKDELMRFIEMQNIPFNTLDIDTIFSQLDTDGDGSVDIQEFNLNFKKIFQ